MSGTRPFWRERRKRYFSCYLKWLGRLDSNQGMAESKSDCFTRNVNTYSEKCAKHGLLPINRLAAVSERMWRLGTPQNGIKLTSG